mgnify:CR=1 FL=1
MESFIIFYLTVLAILIVIYYLNKNNIDSMHIKIIDNIHFPQFLLTRYTSQFLL